MSTTKLNTSPAAATAAARSSVNLDEMGQFTGCQNTTESSETTLFEGAGSGFVYASMFSTTSLASQAQCTVYNGSTSDGVIARGILEHDGVAENHGGSKLVTASPCFYNNGITITGKSDGVAELNVCANILSKKTSGTADILATRSTDIKESDPDTNQSAQTIMTLDPRIDFNNVESCLVYVPLSSLPLGAIVTSATLYLWSNLTGRDQTDVGLYAILEPWKYDEVTWNSRLTGTAWTTPGLGAGTDRRTTAEWFGTLGPYDEEVFVPFDITDVVNEWLAGSLANNGLILAPTVSQGTSSILGFATQLDGDPSERPYMEYLI